MSLQCKILKCNSEFWASTSNSGPEEEFCTALRAYNSCVRRTARTCRGDLAYHSAQHGIEDLMSQHNCSKEGPTSQPRARTPLPPPPPPHLPDSQERSDGPEVCHYERSLARNTAPPNYTHCGFFGDPHLRTFGDDFQTCKVEGAWPLIHNKYLSVQVTNTPVVPGSLATATSKVRILCMHGLLPTVQPSQTNNIFFCLSEFLCLCRQLLLASFCAVQNFKIVSLLSYQIMQHIRRFEKLRHEKLPILRKI